jgi:1A family penicillin-binding protein
MAKKKKKKKQHRFFWFIIKLQIFLMLVVLAGFGYYYFGGYADEVQQLKREAVQEVADSDESLFIPSQTCSVYDTNGILISERKGTKDAEYVKYEDIPKEFVTAIISIEDKKFYSHNGVDFKAVVRVIKARIQKGKVTQGGSTITMQLAKLMYMNPDKTWQYKVKQMFLAMELEKRYSKEKILEFYLNNIYFANGYYGIDAACHGYFDCDLDELDVSQIAYLLAIPNSPTYYDPVENPDHTIERRNLILQNMRDDGKITQEQYYEAVQEEIVLNRPQTKASEKMNNYVDTYTYYCATRALMEQEGFVFQNYFDSDEEEESYNESYDELFSACQKKLYSGGYKIYTSIDLDKQEQLQQAVDDTLAQFTDTNDDGTYEMQASAVSIDNNNGYVVAIVGGRDQDFSSYTLNRAYQSYRQPGSSIKPLIVYTPQFERGYEPTTIVNDHKFEGGPSNASGTYAGKIPLRTAVAKSLNTVAWQLYEELTPEVGLQYLKNMNFSEIQDSDYTLATALGGFTKGVSAVEMASAYSTLENDGLYRQPTCIKSIIDSDENLVYTSSQTEVAIYDSDAARTMTDVLTTVMESGTGSSLRLDNMPCAGKTGTTNDHKDGWFVGYTRYYTTSVWVGCDYPKKIADLSGSTYPGKIWKAYMSAVHEDLAPIDFLPYAKLSDDYTNKQKEEEEEHDKKREENQQKEENDSEKNKNSEENNKKDKTNKTQQDTPAQEPSAEQEQEPADTPDDNQNTDDQPQEPSDDNQNNGDDQQEPDDGGTGEDQPAE